MPGLGWRPWLRNLRGPGALHSRMQRVKGLRSRTLWAQVLRSQREPVDHRIQMQQAGALRSRTQWVLVLRNQMQRAGALRNRTGPGVLRTQVRLGLLHNQRPGLRNLGRQQGPFRNRRGRGGPLRKRVLRSWRGVLRSPHWRL